MLLRGLRETHPKVVRLSEEIARLERVVGLGATRDNARRKEQRLAIEAELEGLANSMKEWEARSLESSRIGAAYDKIRSTLERTRGLYDRLLGSLQNLDARKGVDQELVQILQAASPPQEVDRGLRRRLVSGAVAGITAGFAALLLAVRLDQRSYSVEETMEQLGCRVFVEVPQLPSGTASTGRRRFTESVFEESFRRLRSIVYMGMPAAPAPLFLVTSALPSEGKSEVALNLARAFARTGKKSASDRRRPSPRPTASRVGGRLRQPRLLRTSGGAGGDRRGLAADRRSQPQPRDRGPLHRSRQRAY